MKKAVFSFYFKNKNGQRGEILVTTLIFVILGFMIIVPLLAFMGTGIKTAKVFNQKSSALYAADAGVEDAIWQIKYEHLSSVLTSPFAYSEYDFSTEWQYTLPEQPNHETVNVTIKNVWIPTGVLPLDESASRAIADSGRLLTTGGMVGGTETGYKVTVTYNPQPGESLLIENIGIWIPPGFDYVPDSSNVEQNPGENYYSIPVVTAHNGGYTVVWNFSSADILDFPEVDTLDSPMTFDLSFNFVPAKAGTIPDIVSWMETSGVEGLGFCWDFDVKVFKIISQSDQTVVETYVAKSDLRQLNGALNGDYAATGNTLMKDAVGDSGHIRETWLNAVDHSSTSSVDSIDPEAEVAGAFLYWTAWKQESDITKIAPLNPEDCNDISAWTVTSPNSWAIYNSGSAYSYRGHYATGDSRDLTLRNAINLSSHTAAKVALTWDQRVSGIGTATLFSDDCINITNWTPGTGWMLSSERLRAHYSPVQSDRMITLATPLNLSAYSTLKVVVSWNQSEGGTLESADELYYSFSGDNGATWSANYLAFADDNPADPIPPQTIPGQYLTSQFKVRFYISGFTESGEYAYIDNIKVDIQPVYSATDGLDFAIYNSDTGWSDKIPAFRGDIGTSFTKYHYFVPPQYITADFKVRFSTAGCANPAEYIYIDNIYLRVMYPDDSVFFKVNNHQVYYDEDRLPLQGTGELIADRTDALLNITSGVYKGFSYTGYKDVTELVKNYSNGANQLANPPTYGYGNAAYTTGHVDATLGINGGDYQLAHAGWALIIVYTSPNTFGHQLYLYDTFTYADDYQDLDFDKNGTPGGDITGFIVPERIRNDLGQLETDAAKITCFVGEGDNWITDDFIALNAPEHYWDLDTGNYPPSDIPVGYKLWDGFDNAYKSNVWNGLSTVATADGIDVDTFAIPWDSGIISEGDTTAHIDIYTAGDNWNMVFMIIAFRSETTTGGSLTYLIRG